MPMSDDRVKYKTHHDKTLPLFHVFTNKGNGVRFGVHASDSTEARDRVKESLLSDEYILDVKNIPSTDTTAHEGE
jgi:hypothetical protein